MSVLAELRALLGERGLLTEPTDIAPHLTDWRGLINGRAIGVARPADTAHVAALVRLCVEAGVGMVPQGGNTSMVAGAVPAPEGTNLVVSLSRLDRVREVDALDMTMTVEAGVTLHAAQRAAAEAGCRLPLSIAAEGTAQIGGVLAANAGGNNTLRYGNARDLVLGIEAVLPDGSVLSALRRLRKDNTGYALRHLLVGSEGTLGLITAAVLRLVPAAGPVEVALCAVPSPEAALQLFAAARADGLGVEAFEYISGAAMALVLRHIADAALPFAAAADADFVLIECAGKQARVELEALLETALAQGLVADAVLAESVAQRASLWRLREEQSEAQRRAGASVKNDVSVPVSRVPQLIRGASAAVAALIPGIRAAPFGHVGDGNVHMNFVQPVGADPAAFLARSAEIAAATADVVQGLDGSFSAEHGVGRIKRGMMQTWRGGVELETMQRIKAALDPAGLMNPGVLLP